MPIFVTLLITDGVTYTPVLIGLFRACVVLTSYDCDKIIPI